MIIVRIGQKAKAVGGDNADKRSAPDGQIADGFGNVIDSF